MHKEKIDVLVLDDDPDLCMLMETMLKFAGLNVKRTTNPMHLPQKLEELKPDVLLMDMLLSGVDGKDICMQLKNDDATSEIKIMMISAHPDAREQCLAAGADDFLGKPFDMDIFLGKIHSLLSLKV